MSEQMVDLRCKRCDREADALYLLSIDAGVLIKKERGLSKYQPGQIRRSGQLCSKCMGLLLDKIKGSDFFIKED